MVISGWIQFYLSFFTSLQLKVRRQLATHLRSAHVKQIGALDGRQNRTDLASDVIMRTDQSDITLEQSNFTCQRKNQSS